MNKDKFQIGDLVVGDERIRCFGVGLVIGVAKLKIINVYWLKGRYTNYTSEHYLVKLENPNE